jgi:hypothetical protein
MSRHSGVFDSSSELRRLEISASRFPDEGGRYVKAKNGRKLISRSGIPLNRERGNENAKV